MRKELEQIEKIEQYLKDALSTNEKISFEEQLSSNPELQKHVEFQQSLQDNIQRIGLRLSTQKAYQRYIFKKIALIAGVALTMSMLFFVWYMNKGTEGPPWFGSNTPAVNVEQEWIASAETIPVHESIIIDTVENTAEAIDSIADEIDPLIVEISNSGGQDNSLTDRIEEYSPKLIHLPKSDPIFAEANNKLNQELFELRTDHDTVIESENGIVLYIPKNAFDTPLKKVDFILQEAVTPADIMFSGLNTITKTGDTLETGGMFYVDAFANGKRVNLIKQLTVDVPSDPTKTGMQLYAGEKNKAGQIVWKDPKDMEKPLISVEITDLDFYPPGYEKQMNAWGYFNKEFIDSLYYSFDGKEQLAFKILSNFAPIRYFKKDTQRNAIRNEKLNNANQQGKKNKYNGSIMSQIQNNVFVGQAKKKSRYQLSDTVNGTQAQNELVFDSLTQSYTYPTVFWGSEIPPLMVDSEGLLWNITVQPAGDKVVDVIFELNLSNGTYIYSTLNESRFNMPTQFLFQQEEGEFELVGEIKEIGEFRLDREPNYNARMEDRSIFSHANTVQFIQRIKLKQDTTVIKVNKAYMYCENGIETIAPIEDSLKISIDLKDSPFGLSPAAVHTIWNAKFNNTYLATVEFESRMPWIHRTCNTAILELYIDNLDKNLYEVDQLAAQMLSGSLQQKFLSFAALEHGKVEMSNAAQRELNAYYLTKYNALQEITRLTNKQYWDEQAALGRKLEHEMTNANEREIARRRALDKKEIDYNTNSVYAQLGMTKPTPRANPLVQFANQDISQRTNQPIIPIVANRSVLRGSINSLGWNNVDCLMSVSRDRESARIKGNGKTASIAYSPLKLNVANAEKFTTINVYVVPKAFNSFVKLAPVNSNYIYSLNKELDYRTVAIAWTNDGFYVYQDENTKTGTKTIVLEKMSKEDWEDLIKSSFSSINGMAKEIDYLSYLKADEERENTNNDKRELKRKAEPFVFPCADTIVVQNSPVFDVISLRDKEPSFPGGQEALLSFLSGNFKVPNVNEPSDPITVYVGYTIEKDGSITNVRMLKGQSEAIDAEAIRVVKLMPNWIPAERDGQAISVDFTLPIVIGIK